MKEIILCFNGLGYYKYCQANILLYDNLNNLVYSGQTFNSRIKIKVRNKKIYRMIAKVDYEIIDTYLYVNSNDKYCFSFKRSIIKYNPITFILTDYYYNLPIERGKLIIWQR